MVKRTSTLPQIENVERDPSRLRPFPGNPRVHSKRQIDQLAVNMAAYGFTAPIIIDETNGVLAGHGRLEAARKLELSSVPCRQINGLSPAQKRALVIADNKIALNASWDDEKLGIVLSEILEIDIGFNIELTGFSKVEVDLAIESLTPGDAQDDAEDERLPDIEDVPITRRDDLWVCGHHRLLCGDSLKPESYLQLLGNNRAQMVFTDPPYNLSARAIGGAGRIRHRDFEMAAGEMSSQEFVEFLSTICAFAVAHSENGSIAFFAMDWRHFGEILQAGLKHYSELKNVVVWVKDSPGMGSLYRSQHEEFFVFKNGDAPHINNVELGRHGRSRSNVWRYRGMTSGGRQRLDDLALHPTVKPVALVTDAMRDCSGRGGLVLDPFGGSGTTMIAAEKIGRCARLIEIDPLYVDRSLRRWQAIAHDDAILLATGETFAQVDQRRCAAPDGNTEVA